MADNPRIEELRRRVQADPASIAFAALAEEYRRAGRFEEAIDTCRTGLQRHPSYLSARVTLGRSLLEIQQYDEARKELEHVLKAAPENLAAIRALAEIHERRGETHESLEQYKTVLEAAPREAAPPPAPSAIEWALPKAAPPPPAIKLERIAVAVVTEAKPVAEAKPVPEAKPVAEDRPQSKKDESKEDEPKREALKPTLVADPNNDVIERLERFLSSIHAARRTAHSQQARVAVR
jgi:tetratricopeptide (TPR) repeat protein